MKYNIVFLVFLSFLFINGCAKSKEEKELKISENNVSIRIEGAVYPSAKQEVVASASGKLKYLYIKYGKRVKKGDLLYSLDKKLISLDIKNKHIEIDSLKKIRKNLRNKNNKGESEEIYIAARELKKISFLKSQGYVHAFEENQYKKNYLNTLNANRDRAATAYEKMKTLETLIATKKIELEKLYYRLKHSDGFADIDGFVADIQVKKGENIGLDKKVCTIINLDKVIVKAGFATGLLPFIHKNRDAKVSFVTTPPYKTVAKITEITPIVNPSFESMTLDIVVENHNYMLQEGTRALVNINLSKEGQKSVRKYFINNKNDRMVQIQSKI